MAASGRASSRSTACACCPRSGRCRRRHGVRSGVVRPDDLRALQDAQASRERNRRWLEKNGYVVSATSLFTHGCGPVEVTVTNTEGKFYKNTADLPYHNSHPINIHYNQFSGQLGISQQQVIAQLLGGLGGQPIPPNL